ncbi:hypothetical protein Tco_1221585 [Tanacetum coccineum]
MTSKCDMVGQIMQKKEEERRIMEEQVAKEDMSIEEMRHEQQLVDYKIKKITNDLGYKRFQGEKILKKESIDLEDILQIQDVNLRERLLKISRLISNIESLKDKPTPDRVFKSPSSFPIPVVDSDSFFEETDTSLSHLDNSLPEFETFTIHTERDENGSTTTHGRLTSVVISDNSNDLLLEIPEFESFHFDPSFPRPPPEPPDVEKCLEPEAGILISKVFKGVSKPHDFMADILPTLPTLVSDLTFILFLSSFLSFRSEDTIFDPDIFT